MEYSPCPHGIFSSRVCEICEALEPVQKQLELYVAEMSEAKSAGFQTAQDLFTSYKALHQQVLEQQAVIATAKAALSMAWSDKYINGIEARKMAEVVQQIGYSQALTEHVNTEKVKMLEDVEKRLTAYEQHTAANQVYGMIAELTKDKQ